MSFASSSRITCIGLGTVALLTGCGASSPTRSPVATGTPSASTPPPPSASATVGGDALPPASAVATPSTPAGSVDVPQLGLRFKVPPGVSYVHYSAAPNFPGSIGNVVFDLTLSSGTKCSTVGGITEYTSDPAAGQSGPAKKIGGYYYSFGVADGAPSNPECGAAGPLFDSFTASAQQIPGG